MSPWQPECDQDHTSTGGPAGSLGGLGVLGDIGTREWARRTNGILGRGERARYIAAVLLEQRRAPRLIAARAGLGRSSPGPDPSELVPPDTPVAREVVEEVAGALSDSVVEHSYRSYLFARALAMAEAIECDEEALFAAAMFHDYGMAATGEIGERCFTIPGAEGAEGVLERAGWGPDRVRTAAEAITLHLNPVVGIEHGEVAHLVHGGVILDLLGLRAWELDGAGIERVRERHPRLGFNRFAGDFLRRHGRSLPGCRAAALFASGFSLAVRLGLWQD